MTQPNLTQFDQDNDMPTVKSPQLQAMINSPNETSTIKSGMYNN